MTRDKPRCTVRRNKPPESVRGTMMDHPSRRAATATIHVAVPFISGVSQNELLEGELVFDPTDPYAVTMHLEARSGTVVWTFARELLADGIYQPSGNGDVQI